MTLCTGEVSVPLTTSTPQKGCSATCLPEDDNTSSGLAADNNNDAIAVVNTQIIAESDDYPSSSKTLPKILPSEENVSEYRKHKFQSKMTRALLTTIGYHPKLDELDKLRRADNTGSNEYMILKQFFRQKLALFRTKVQKEASRGRQGAYATLSKELKNATVLLTHLA